MDKKTVWLQYRISSKIVNMATAVKDGHFKHKGFMQVVKSMNTIELLPGTWLDAAETKALMKTHNVIITSGEDVDIEEVTHKSARNWQTC